MVVWLKGVVVWFVIILAETLHGKLLESYALRWGNQTQDGSWAYIPMGGKINTERTFGGFTIPSKVIAGWWFDSRAIR